MNDTLKKWLLYGFGGLFPLWLLDTVVLPRFPLPALPVLLPLCVAACAVLEGAFFGAQFGLLCGFIWACAYAAGIPWYIPLLTLAGMLTGVITQYALRRSLWGCLLCAGGVMTTLELLRLLGGVINDLAPLKELTAVAAVEWLVSMACTPLVYALVYFLYRRAGGKPV